MQSKLLFLSLFLATTGTGYLLPRPPGNYNVTLTTGLLTDYNRDGRKLMVSIFQPAKCTSIVPVSYMPNKSAEHEGAWLQGKYMNITGDLTPVLLEARLPVCTNSISRCTRLDEAPVLIFSPGYRGTRLYYNFLASALAGEGFVVITMDHPGETNVITYPDGHVAYENLPDVSNIDELTPLAYIRADDASFVIDQLSNATAMSKLLSQNGPQKLLHDRVAMVGHSLGGAAAMLAAAQDSRVQVVINWDGPFFGSLPASGLSQSVLYIGSDREDDPRMLAKWPELHGPKLWIKISNMYHEAMMDFPTLLQAAGQDSARFADVLGSIPPTESVRILTEYAKEWLNSAFAGKVGGPLLQGQEPDRFPDVSTVRKDNF